MNNMKKFASLLLALVMVLAMAAPAMADAVVNNTSGHSYDAYQIFSGTQAVDNSALADIEWGTGVNGENLLATLKADYDYFDDCTTAKDVADVLAGKADNCDEAKALANAAAEHLTTTKVSIAADASSVTLAAGYYLLIDTSALTGDNKVDAHNSALLQVTNKDSVTIGDKYEAPSVEKKINEESELVDLAEKNIGDTVKYVLTGTVPSNYDDYDVYKYVFHDTLSEGLTLQVDTIEVYVKNGETESELTEDFTIVTANLTDDCTFEVQFADLKKIESVISTSNIIVKYDAILNEKAVIDGPNPNTVDLEYSNNPNFDADPDDNPDTPELTPPTGVTPPDQVDVYTTEVHIEKVDEAGNALTGATFQITGETLKKVVVTTSTFEEDAEGTYWKLKDGTYTTVDPSGESVDTTLYEDTSKKYKITTTEEVQTQSESVNVKKAVGQDGKLSFAGLGAGTYTITEIETPAGYNTIATITLTITFDETTKTFSYEWTGGATGTTNTIQVINVAGKVLPETGGMGTTLFYAVGGLLVAGAVVVLMMKKRNAA